MIIADIAMYATFIISAGLIIFCCVVMKNTIADTKKNNRIRENGIACDAEIVNIYQEDVQNVEGWLQLILTVRFHNLRGEEIKARKDIGVKILNVDILKVHSTINIKYSPDNNQDVIIIAEGIKN